MISPGVAVEGSWFPPVSEFLRPLPPRFRPPRLPPQLPPKEPPERSPPTTTTDYPYQVYNPYYNPYLYPYLSRPPVDLYSPPQSPLRPPKGPPPQPPPQQPPPPPASPIVVQPPPQSLLTQGGGGGGGESCGGPARRTRLRPSRAAGFARGSLIRLSTGELRRVEEMRTEDFISSADSSPQLRLDPSTVVRIEAPHTSDLAVLTLRYGKSRAQVEVESSADHPFFVYGQGWASCRPEKTLATYGLKCHHLQVGDVCISLSPRPPGGDRKRRWSAPDQIQDNDQPTDYHKPRSQPPPSSP